MPSFSFKLGLIILAALALHIEAQTTRLSSVQRLSGFRDKHGLRSRLQEFVVSSGKRCGKSCGVRRGSSPHDGFAKHEKSMDSSVTASQETALNATREDRFLQRDLFRKPRNRRWISKRKLQKQLQECEARLQETQDALDTPRLLFIQMAQHCTLERVAGRYYLRTTDMDADTYAFTEMPLEQATVWPTSYFVGYLFDEFFPVEKPNAAFTFNVYNNQSEKTFEGPLISVLLSSHQIILQEDNSTLVVYELGQSSEQEATSPLSRFFRGTDPLGNASVMYEHCSLFIDPAFGDDDGNVGESFMTSIHTPAETASILETTAQTVERGPPPSNTPQSKGLRTYDRVWRVKDGEGKLVGGVESKDYLKGAADTMRSMATLIKECKGKSCDTRTIIEGVSNILLAGAFVVGAAFPPVGIALTIVGSLGILISSLFFDPPSSAVGVVGISPLEIQDAVKKGLARYDAAKDKGVIDEISREIEDNLDDFVRAIGRLAYIRDQKKGDFQATIDSEIFYWKRDYYDNAFKKVDDKLAGINSDYNRWFGTANDESNLRVDVVNWINDNANKCRVVKKPDSMPKGTYYDQYPPPVYHSEEVEDFQNCRKNVDEGPEKWDRLMGFAETYLRFATALTIFSSQAIVIMQMASSCDPAKYDQDTTNDICKYNHAIVYLLTSVSHVQERALFLRRVLDEIDDQCFHARGWPFSQTCSSTYCNYKWSLSLSPKGDGYGPLKHNLDNIGFFKIAESNSENIWETCHNFRYNSGKDGFGDGGFWAYQYGETSYLGLNRLPMVSYRRTQRYDDCGHLSEFLDSGFLFGAVPNYALKPDLPKCAALIDDSSLWGPDYSSDTPLKRYTPNLSCKRTSMVSYYFNDNPEDPINECWNHCYNEAKLRPIFFFTVMGTSLICICFSSCLGNSASTKALSLEQ